MPPPDSSPPSQPPPMPPPDSSPPSEPPPPSWPAPSWPSFSHSDIRSLLGGGWWAQRSRPVRRVKPRLPSHVMEPLVDGWDREIRSLRVSVTDKCNFRCRYCMPAEGLEWLERDELL